MTLAGVHPTLLDKLGHVWEAMVALGFPMKATAGVRTTAQQSLLWAQGRFGNAGPIVTHCDGIHAQSNHQVKADGFGHAVDCCFVGDDPYLVRHPQGKAIWAAYGACCEAVGLIWGGHFTTMVDQPHAELPE